MKTFSFAPVYFLTLALFLLFPPTSWATESKYVPISPSCSPSLTETKTQICPYNANQGATGIKLNWNLNSSNCILSGVGNNWRNAFYYKDHNNYATSTIPATNAQATALGLTRIKSSDSILIANPKIGEYQTTCCQNQVCQFSDKFKVPGYLKSCEVPFGTIVESLKNSQHTVITEKDFRSWGEVDLDDFCDYSVADGKCQVGNLGSGNKNDLIGIFNESQSCYRRDFISSSSKRLPTDFKLIRTKIKKFTSNGNPISLSYVVGLMVEDDNQTLYKEMGSHVVIAYDLQDLSFFPQQKFVIKVVDSNGAQKDDLTCQTRYFGDVLGSLCVSLGLEKQVSKALDDLKKDDPFNYMLAMSFFDEYHPIPVAILYAGDSAGGFLGEKEEKFINEREKICSSSNLKMCDKTPAERIANDFPGIINMEGATTENADGYCYGWSDFVLRVAYLGDFVGEDYHPNDGKYVGIDCDQNHYPIKKTSWTDPVNWLGNVLSPVTRLWEKYVK